MSLLRDWFLVLSKPSTLSPSHSFTSSPLRFLTHLLLHSFTTSLPYSFTLSGPQTFFLWSFTSSLICALPFSFFIHSFIHSFTHSARAREESNLSCKNRIPTGWETNLFSAQQVWICKESCRHIVCIVIKQVENTRRVAGTLCESLQWPAHID